MLGRRRSRLYVSFLEVIVNKFGLLLMDYEVAVCSRLPEEARSIFPRVKKSLEVARAGGVPIIHVRVAFDEHYTLRTSRSPRFAAIERHRAMLQGSADVEFIPEARPLPGEPVITKGCVNPFIGTALMELLIGRGIGELYLGGVVTNYVVESTTRHAADTGFTVNVIEDLCAGFEAEMHDFSMKKILPTFANICSLGDFEKRVNAVTT